MNQTHYKIAINDTLKIDCTGSERLSFRKNDWCIVRCHNFDDYGRVTHICQSPPPPNSKTKPGVVIRRATLVDQGKAHENSVRSKSFHRRAVEEIKINRLRMKLISSHFTFDRTLVIFIFTAPERVDFRDLVKSLSQKLACRVEFRQLGPRDYAAMVGGIESCGRMLCCSTFLTNFVSINMKMAKDQNISLNPSNIIGACGRLKCCLSFEHEGYKLLTKKMPKSGSRCNCNGCEGKVLDSNALTQTVKISLDNGSRIITAHISELSDKTS